MNNKEQQNIQSEKTLTEIFKYNAEAGASGVSRNDTFHENRKIHTKNS